jgi:hypothetical protein
MGRIARPPADDQEAGSARPRAYRLHGDPNGAGDVKRPVWKTLPVELPTIAERSSPWGRRRGGARLFGPRGGAA